MMIDDREEILNTITKHLHDAGIKTHGKQVTIEELVASPAIGVALFGQKSETNWRYHQHQLLDFVQSFNTDEMLSYIENFL